MTTYYDLYHGLSSGIEEGKVASFFDSDGCKKLLQEEYHLSKAQAENFYYKLKKHWSNAHRSRKQFEGRFSAWLSTSITPSGIFISIL